MKTLQLIILFAFSSAFVACQSTTKNTLTPYEKKMQSEKQDRTKICIIFREKKGMSPLSTEDFISTLKTYIDSSNNKSINLMEILKLKPYPDKKETIGDIYFVNIKILPSKKKNAVSYEFVQSGT